MAKKETKQGHTTEELLENPEALAEEITKAEQFLEKNKGLTFGILTLIVVVIGGYFAYNYFMEDRNREAQSEMFQAVFYFEADSLDLAINGDGNNLGFKDIIDEYSGTDAANLANYYTGVSYLRQGDYKLAILYLEDFSSDDLLVQAKAFSLIGDAHMEQDNFQSASEYYNKAANYKENKFFTPGYLMKAALAFEKMNDNESAIKCYDRIIKNFAEASEVNDAKKHKARLSTIAS